MKLMFTQTLYHLQLLIYNAYYESIKLYKSGLNLCLNWFQRSYITSKIVLIYPKVNSSIAKRSICRYSLPRLH